MIAAIYARRSPERRVTLKTKWVTRQVENAKAFAAARGWVVPDAHVYVDDGMSGAEFERRPSFMRMMSTLPRPPFRVFIVERAEVHRTRGLANQLRD